MPYFKYSVKDEEGKAIIDEAEARSKEALVELLRKQKFTIISVDEQKSIEVKQAKLARRIKLDDLVIFTRQLATMVEAGIPLVNVLDILSQQIEKKGFKAVIAKIRDDVETGSSFSQGLAKHPNIFSQLYINMVKAGESSGLLDEILNRVSTYLEKTAALQRKVKSAMVYPITVISIAIGITIFLLVKVVPTFKGIFDMLGGSLPLPTQILLSVSGFLQHWFILGFIGLIIFIVVMSRYIKTEQGALAFDTFMLKLPIFGNIIRKVSVAKFSRTLSTLVKSGVPILSSLEIVAKTSGNKVVEIAINNTKQSVREGKNLAEPLAKSTIFPPMVVRMIAVGEQAGELEKMLTKIADFYDEQVDAAVSGLTSLLEPLIIVFLGVVIGGIVLAIFLPIFKITEIIGH
ncbi:MAG: type II secretion system F family protein [Candidatus Omnitrophica bacterium]|nr:type II secretion system F family protein [Candidatus Omnitrophota bacterium]